MRTMTVSKYLVAKNQNRLHTLNMQPHLAPNAIGVPTPNVTYLLYYDDHRKKKRNKKKSLLPMLAMCIQLFGTESSLGFVILFVK